MHEPTADAVHALALARIGLLLDTALIGTDAGDELQLLLALVEWYERNDFPVAPRDRTKGKTR